MNRHRLLFLVNEDSFFVSHRLELGIAAREAGFDVVVVGGEGGGREVIEKAGLRSVPLEFDRGGRSLTRDARTLAKITALYRRERPSLVHHVTIKPVLYGSMAAKATGVRAVVNAISGLGFVFLSGGVAMRVVRAGVEMGYRLALSGSQVRVIFQNPEDERFFVERRLVEARCAVRFPGSGVDLSRFSVRPFPAAGPPLVVLPARMLWDKGIGEFVEAARKVRAAGIPARFALVGGESTNPARVPVEQLRQWEAEGVVEWWGHRSDMPEVLAQSSLVVLPSYREGFPLALAEACAVGRACVTTDVPGCREVARAVGAWLVPPRDAAAIARAILEALSDPERLENQGRSASTVARSRFDRSAIVTQHMTLYRELLGDREPGA